MEVLPGYIQKKFPELKKIQTKITEYLKTLQTEIGQVIIIRKQKTEQVMITEFDPQKLNEAVLCVSNPKMEASTDIEKYMQSMNYISEYNGRIQQLKAPFGTKLLQNFENYNRKVNSIQTKYGKQNIQDWAQYMQNFQSSISNFQK